MSGYIKPYRTYVFRNKDPIIDKLRTVVDDSKQSYSLIAESSGVSATTIYNWFHGKTRRPQFATLNAVARSLGRELTLTERMDKTSRRQKKPL